MKTLYISDLDGTLLSSSGLISEYTAKVINELTEKGMLFSYGTARSFVTASKVTRNIRARIPAIVYNGTMTVDSQSGRVLLSNYFDIDIKMILSDLLDRGIYPIVYTMIGGKEKFLYVEDKCTEGMQEFIDTRDDERKTPVKCREKLLDGDIFYLSCIDEKEKLEPLYHKYKNECRCLFHKEVYTGRQWLEIMPKCASKAIAVKQLKEYLQAEKVIVFGDGKNDIDMFEAADEAYAVENAVDELKNIAAAVIDSNNADGVAKWLKENVKI